MSADSSAATNPTSRCAVAAATLAATIVGAMLAALVTPEVARAQPARAFAAGDAEPDTSYFPEEEEHLAAYLNLRFYQFKD